MKKATRTFAIWIAVFAVIIGVVIAANCIAIYWDQALVQALGVVGEGVSEDTTGNVGDTQYFKRAYTDEQLSAAQEEFVERAAGEGIVMLKNGKVSDSEALPLSGSEKISMFGIASTQSVVSGSGSGNVVSDSAASYYGSLTAAGFDVNTTLRDFYADCGHSRGSGTSTGGGADTGDWHLDEVHPNDISADAKASISSYNDVAVVIFARGSGEGGDLPYEMSRHGGSASEHYLELDQDERALLEYVESLGFDKTIVFINSGNTFETGFVDDARYGVDACFWYSGLGANGINAIGKILKGDINPSGRTVDTWDRDHFSSPAMQNFGDFRYVDASGKLTGYSYVNYAETIYVGYKYYETRYEDVVLGADNVGTFDYSTQVQYPFGYGLGYSDFSFSEFTATEPDENGDVTVTVTVTNDGEYDGKDVVELYYQSEYTDYDRGAGLEKASVNLLDMYKTDIIEAGASETVNITFNISDMKSYDSSDENETYILEAGTYYFTAAHNAHDAVNNILAAKQADGISVNAAAMTEAGDAAVVGSYEAAETVRYPNGAGELEITNRFDDARASDAKYLTRDNWSAMDNNGLRYATGSLTDVSNVSDAAGTVGTVVASPELTSELSAIGYDASGAPAVSSRGYPAASTYTYGADNGRELIDLRGKPYDDPMWGELLDQMSNSEMHSLFNKGGYGTGAIDSINKPRTYEYDGPAGISNFINPSKRGYSYLAEITFAATWNKDILREYGEFVGEDALRMGTERTAGVAGWYAPAMNIHRTPFAGRNYEYYSEDGRLSGLLAAETVSAVQAKGMYTYIKHFALNDQETNRAATGCAATWSTEQAIREIYLEPFRMAVEDGGSHALMTSFNRIGATQAYGNYTLITEVLRGEWGFEGTVLTDYQASLTREEVDQCLAAGGDLILNTAGLPLSSPDSDWSRAELRRAAHNILFTVVNSLAMNGFYHGATYSAGFPVYGILLIVLDVAAVAGVGVGLFFVLRKFLRSRKETPSDTTTAE